ncbi:MAG: protein-disulfide reductase DsbD domain-containing protein [Rhodospirillaceae bacterium]
MKIFTALYCVTLLLLSTGVTAPVSAATGPTVPLDMVDARLMTAVDAAGNSASVPLGLEIRLKPGWKTYWRSPGDAGLPPRIDWSGSVNLAGTEIAWPAPVRFTLFGLETFGYVGEVVLPITARRTGTDRPLELRAGVDLLVCHDICVPARFDLSLNVPAGPAAPSADAEQIARYARTVPGNGRDSGLSVTVAQDLGGNPPVLKLEADARDPFATPDLFLEGGSPDSPLIFKAPEVRLERGGRHLTARLVLVPAGGAAEPVRSLIGRPLPVTLVDGTRSVETRLTVTAATAGGEPGLALILVLALLGGLILNLMPCVLPVLSLKVLSVLGHGGGDVRAVRAGFLASAAGIVCSFLGLAAVMIALKAAGAAAGWGIQFQQPLFLAVMAVVVALFAGNLWGLFEVPLPRFIAAAAEKPESPGALAGPFLTGLFATLLATPCSAPFLGTAVGFALARGPMDILAVFLALGLGLALPYLMVAAFPRIATALPRPGRWMITLRRGLGLALAATALWLLWLLVAVMTPPPMMEAALEHAPGRAEADGWLRFDPTELQTKVAAGQVVFVDVTADWCLTCIANKRLVLDRPEVAARLHDPAGSVVTMRADWTRPDPAISAYLASFGRYGVPFNAVYGPGAPEGLALPELLNSEAVLEGLARAARRETRR